MFFGHPDYLVVGNVLARVPIGGNSTSDVLPEVVLVRGERDVVIYRMMRLR